MHFERCLKRSRCAHGLYRFSSDRSRLRFNCSDYRNLFERFFNGLDRLSQHRLCRLTCKRLRLTTRFFFRAQTRCKLLGLRKMLFGRFIRRRALHIGALFTILNIHRGGFAWRARRNFKLLLATTLEGNARGLRRAGILAVRSTQSRKQALLVGI